MNQQTRISDDRLAQIVDHEVNVFDWEIPIIAAELLARRASARQEHLESMRAMRNDREGAAQELRQAREIMECNDPLNARELFGDSDVVDAEWPGEKQ